jgi:hypothetical protein
MKRSHTVTLALMGTASFAASFVAGSALLAWTRPLPEVPAAVAAASAGPVAPAASAVRTASAAPVAVPVAAGAMTPPRPSNCTIRPDGSQSCPSSSSSSSSTRVILWGPGWLYPTGMRGEPATPAANRLVSSPAQNLAASRAAIPDGAARGGFGSTSRGMAHASAAS